jgi:hypothetical protein
MERTGAEQGPVAFRREIRLRVEAAQDQHPPEGPISVRQPPRSVPLAVGSGTQARAPSEASPSASRGRQGCRFPQKRGLEPIND